MLLHFHGDFQDGVLRPLIKIIEKQIYNFFKVIFFSILNDFTKCSHYSITYLDSPNY